MHHRNHCASRCSQFLAYLHGAFLMTDVESSSGLVEKHTGGVLGQYPGKGHPGEFSPGQSGDLSVRQPSDFGALHRGLDENGVLWAAWMRGTTHHDDVVNQVGERELAELGHHGAAEGQVGSRDILQRNPVEFNGSLPTVEVSAQHAQQSRLAGPVGPEQADEFSGADVKIDSVQDCPLPVPKGNATGTSHHDAPPRRNRMKKVSPPTMAVKMPMGRSA